LDSIRGKISSPAIKKGTKTGKITITGANGKIKIIDYGDGFYVDENGNVIFDLEPSDLIDIEDYYDENTDEYIFPPDFNYPATFEFVITDEDTGEEIIIVAPVDFIFNRTSANPCLLLNRSFVNESTHYGSLSIGAKMAVICPTNSKLTSFVTWESERMGNVEISSVKNFATVLTDYNKVLLPLPVEGEYNMKIIFTPFSNAVGKKAYFSVNFLLEGVTSKIDFEVPIDNLEQCVKITGDELFLAKDKESVSFTIDASTCYSDKVNISLCDNDLECSGGTEGGIELSQYSFVLSPKGSSSKQITIKKDEIAGAYGIPVYARVSGASKVLVDEKIVTIEPFKGEEVYPEKFVVSLLGGEKDSITVRNNSLSEDVEVNSTICNLYKSSMGIKSGASFASAYSIQNLSGDSWWKSLSSDSEKYAGVGKYQASIFSSIGELEKKRILIQNESTTRNTSIKKAYTMTVDVVDKINAASEGTEDMIVSLTGLSDKLGEANKYADLDLTSQIVSLATTVTNLSTLFLYMTADMGTVVSATNTMNGFAVASCPAAATGTGAALASVTKAQTASTSLTTELTSILTASSSIYSIYSTVSTFAKDTENINADSALSNTNNALDKLNAAKAEAQLALDFAELALAAASINTFYTISTEDFKSKNYLEDVLTHMQNVLSLLTQAQEYLTDALDDITIAIPEAASNTENIISITASIVQLVTMLPFMESGLSEMMTELTAAQTATTSALGPAATVCAVSLDTSPCCLFPTYATPVTTAITSTHLAVSKTMQEAFMAVSLTNSVYSLFSTYQTMTNDYTDDYTNSSAELSELIPKINAAKAAAQALIDFLPTAISDAKWLGDNSIKVSDISSYTSEDYGVDGEEYNKKRMNGLIGTALGNAFVNGAYVGGVYSTDPDFSAYSFSNQKETDENKTKISFANETTLKEDCENIVTLTLTDYIINIIKDAQKPSVSANGIIAVWDYSNAKVFDVFEEQTVDMVFSNNGLKKNVYGILQMPVSKHTHEQPTTVTGKFGPFNVPDKSEEVTYKYHMKFNTIPRKSNNFTKPTGENACISGILRGETGDAKSTPRIILSWDWNSVVIADSSQMQNNVGYFRTLSSAVIGTNSNLEPYLDSTQLSILISKKLGSLDYYLETASTECPVNPAEEIIKEVAPVIDDGTNNNTYTSSSDDDEDCYLPLSTKEYDGKPSLYYYLPEKNSALDPVYSDDSKKDIMKVKDREEFLKLVDFNAFLMRDGYGIDFQSDFVSSFSSKIFSSAFSFMNSQTGMRTYFFNSDRFFFSSKANTSTSKTYWALPDAGKYRIRLFIDFDDSPRLFLSSSPSAKIIVLLDLIKPVDADYSPLYYTPIDGFTGLSANNNRIGYGSSLFGGNDLDIVNSQGVILSSQQNKSLNRINFTKTSDFFVLNAFPSMRSKILDYTLSPALDNTSSIIFSPTVATPVIFEISEKNGSKPILNYSVSKEGMDLSSSTSSMTILSTLPGCFDYTGSIESSFINNGSDVGDGKVYGAFLPISTKDGKNYVKTVFYAPLPINYFLSKPVDVGAITPSAIGTVGTDVILGGVVGMHSNNSQAGQTVESLENIIKGVEKGSVCIAKLGTREVFFWPEEQMFDEKYVGSEFYDKIQTAQDTCIKEIN
jgi:hypothetical protein